MPFGEDFVAGEVNRRNWRVMRLRLKHILGDVDQDRPGPPARSDIERLMDYLR